MRCYIVNTAEAYDITSLHKDISKENKAQIHRNVIHVEADTQFGHGNIFYFSYGCVICWGLSEEEEAQFISYAAPHAHKPLKNSPHDLFTFMSGETSHILNGEIVLANKTSLTLSAISHGLAQSVKLDAFENRVQQTYNQMKHIPEEVAKKGRISLSRRQIRKKMAALFIERNSINLHCDILDKPEFFWEFPEVEPLYTMIANYLDIETRVQVLNQRLGVIHELFEMMGNELNHQHSSRLEWIIIILIFIEIAMSLLKEFG